MLIFTVDVQIKRDAVKKITYKERIYEVSLIEFSYLFHNLIMNITFCEEVKEETQSKHPSA